MALNKFKNLPPDFTEQLRHIVTEIGAYATARKYHERANMSLQAFYRQLSINFGEGKKPKTKFNSKGKEIRTLTEEEELFLEKLGKGEVSLAEASKLVAAKVFRKMLENPDDVKFIDFFRTELLKLKESENKVKETWSKEIIARMFAGHTPPQVCPKCGFNLVPDSPSEPERLIQGEEIKDEK